MARIDVFNGDADGICALTQLRNAYPGSSRVVTGVKRDIALVEKAGIEAGDEVTVLDLSLDKNRDAVAAALEIGAEIFYVDHHFAGDIPAGSGLKALIDPSPDVCTSILMNGHLEGRYVEWAIVGAFGDNLKASAQALAAPLSLSGGDIDRLENLGIYMNYNGYGAALEDLHFEPAELFRLVSAYENPLSFISDGAQYFEKLETGYRDDMARARDTSATRQSDRAAVFMFPNEAWARRVSGVYSNDLANASPKRAHAVVTERADGTYLVSVRAPLSNKFGASELCRRFPTGGGREAAAGINNLPADQLEDFMDQFAEFYSA
ncbi:MAG: DHH family phosphoesterase [bacterium]|nr:DHH family phosphoesterase [bacterium]